MSDANGQMTFAHAFWRNVRERPEAVALADRNVELTYADVGSRAAEVIAELERLGVRRGDRIGIAAPNRLDVVLVMVAAAAAGVTVAPANWRLPAAAAAEYLGGVAPSAVFCSHAHRAVAEGVPGAAVIDLDEDPRWRARPGTGRHGLDPHRVSGSDPMTIMSTSGSTGRPKGVVISQAAMVARALVLHAELGVDALDSFVGWAPLFHISSTDYLYASLILGGTFVVHQGFDPQAVTRELLDRDVGWLFLIPGLIPELLAALGERRPRRVKYVGAMADLVAPNQLRDAEERLGAPYLNTFGSTEAGLVPGAGPVAWDGGRPRLDKRVTMFCQHRIVNDQGEDVEPGVPGELWLRGPTLFSGYWEDGRLSRAAFRGGWFPTGDLVRATATNAIEFVERRGRMFKCGGENVYPATIERTFLAHPAVGEAAVVPVPHPRFQQVPAAYVALAEEIDTATLLEECATGLAAFERPFAVHVLGPEQFPRGVTGKVVRDRLAEEHPRCGPECWRR
ncbi:fatty-acyl-CoA synthase [Thermomonospora echinospora]|uniref:Fatty-acyl-CoA synthase n=1 Tax=Thermomonospora echinospora TaxID=1992 RepID=A0A1H6ANF2_9ACTN|nr:class I adenylate-forming enzyme family protein [Thermomonospora echinospora]SEG49575.1 fatty-acyl-CoA synthase [Thermomonospora echinospora]